MPKQGVFGGALETEQVLPLPKLLLVPLLHLLGRAVAAPWLTAWVLHRVMLAQPRM